MFSKFILNFTSKHFTNSANDNTRYSIKFETQVATASTSFLHININLKNGGLVFLVYSNHTDTHLYLD